MKRWTVEVSFLFSSCHPKTLILRSNNWFEGVSALTNTKENSFFWCRRPQHPERLVFGATWNFDLGQTENQISVFSLIFLEFSFVLCSLTPKKMGVFPHICRSVFALFRQKQLPPVLNRHGLWTLHARFFWWFGQCQQVVRGPGLIPISKTFASRKSGGQIPWSCPCTDNDCGFVTLIPWTLLMQPTTAGRYLGLATQKGENFANLSGCRQIF